MDKYTLWLDIVMTLETKPNHCSKCGEHYRSEWHLNNCDNQ